MPSKLTVTLLLLNTARVAMFAGFSFVEAYLNEMLLWDLISLTLFLTNIVRSLSPYIHLKTHFSSVHKQISSMDNYNCSFTNASHLTLMSTAISSALGKVIPFTGISVFCEHHIYLCIVPICLMLIYESGIGSW